METKERIAVIEADICYELRKMQTIIEEIQDLQAEKALLEAETVKP
jgi:hypothetical protein